MGFINNYKALRSAAHSAGYGKKTAGAVAKGTSVARSSGALKGMKDLKMAKYVAANKGRSALIGGAGMGLAMGVARTRRSGLNKGRTGMYGY